MALCITKHLHGSIHVMFQLGALISIHIRVDLKCAWLPYFGWLTCPGSREAERRMFQSS